MKASLQREFWVRDVLDFRSEGVKYAGSKSKLIKYILPEVESLGVRTVLDGFAGTTRVSQALARMGLSVTINDKAILSTVFGKCYLMANPDDSRIAEKLRYLNDLPSVEGWFTHHYGGYPETPTDEAGNRKPWQRHNTMRLDAIRPQIDVIAENEIEKSVLLTSLILAMDGVDSTLGHYAAYLSKWSSRSFNPMNLRMPDIVGRSDDQNHRFYCGDIEQAISKNRYDLCYFDPPYGSNNEKMPPSRVRYGGYYHIWKTIILNDKPKLFGRVNRRQDSRDVIDYSAFEDFRRSKSGGFICVEAIEHMISMANARFVMLSYSSGGRATFDSLIDVLNANGKIRTTLKIDHAKHVMSSMTWTGKWVKDEVTPHHEFLFVLEKN